MKNWNYERLPLHVQRAIDEACRLVKMLDISPALAAQDTQNAPALHAALHRNPLTNFLLGSDENTHAAMTSLAWSLYRRGKFPRVQRGQRKRRYTRGHDVYLMAMQHVGDAMRHILDAVFDDARWPVFYRFFKECAVVGRQPQFYSVHAYRLSGEISEWALLLSQVRPAPLSLPVSLPTLVPIIFIEMLHLLRERFRASSSTLDQSRRHLMAPIAFTTAFALAAWVAQGWSVLGVQPALLMQQALSNGVRSYWDRLASKLHSNFGSPDRLAMLERLALWAFNEAWPDERMLMQHVNDTIGAFRVKLLPPVSLASPEHLALVREVYGEAMDSEVPGRDTSVLYWMTSLKAQRMVYGDRMSRPDNIWRPFSAEYDKDWRWMDVKPDAHPFLYAPVPDDLDPRVWAHTDARTQFYAARAALVQLVPWNAFATNADNMARAAVAPLEMVEQADARAAQAVPAPPVAPVASEDDLTPEVRAQLAALGLAGRGEAFNRLNGEVGDVAENMAGGAGVAGGAGDSDAGADGGGAAGAVEEVNGAGDVAGNGAGDVAGGGAGGARVAGDVAGNREGAGAGGSVAFNRLNGGIIVPLDSPPEYVKRLRGE